MLNASGPVAVGAALYNFMGNGTHDNGNNNNNNLDIFNSFERNGSGC